MPNQLLFPVCSPACMCFCTLLFSAWLWPAPSLAASGIWRCVDDQGQITWSDLGCRGRHSIHHPSPSTQGLVPVAGNGLTSAEQEQLDALQPAPLASARTSTNKVSRPQGRASATASTDDACASARAAVAKHRQRGRQGYRANSSSAHQQQRLDLRRAVQEHCG